MVAIHGHRIDAATVQLELATLAQQLGRSLPDCNEDMGWPDGPSRLSENKPAI